MKENALNILLVEDDDGDAKAVERAFQKLKGVNTIVRAIDGLEALEILRNLHSKKIAHPYLLLVDLNMPKMGGIELIQALRDDPLLHRAIIFILTTSKRDEDIAASYDLNVAGYILKKTAGEDFLNLVDLVDSYQRIVEVPS